MNNPLTLLPAVDVRDGQSVRLSPDGQSLHGSPLDAALSFQSKGAHWIHLVDLDAAFGRGDNREVLENVIAQLSIPVQLSGGIDDDESVKWATSTGATRVNLSSKALSDVRWVNSLIDVHRERLAISLDVHGERVIARGSGVDVGPLDDVLDQLQHASTFVVTDTQRDGSLQGVNMELLREVQKKTSAKIIASGGMASLEEIDHLRGLGVEGAVVGKALYAGTFTLEEALERAVR